MNRRSLLKAAPAAVLAGVVPAMAAEETPVIRSYRVWTEYWRWLNSSQFPEVSDEEFEGYAQRACDMSTELVRMPSTGPLDILAKISAATSDCEGLMGEHPEIYAVIAGINALLSGGSHRIAA